MLPKIYKIVIAAKKYVYRRTSLSNVQKNSSSEYQLGLCFCDFKWHGVIDKGNFNANENMLQFFCIFLFNNFFFGIKFEKKKSGRI